VALGPVIGLERLRPCKDLPVYANHQSLVDVAIFWICLGLNVAYLAKKELLRNPVLRYGFPVIGVVTVDRRNRTAAVNSARMAAENLRSGKSYVVYPEGTRSPDGRLLPFKKGAFIMAMELACQQSPSRLVALRSCCAGKMSVRPQLPASPSTSDSAEDTGTELIELTRARIESAL
jgi:1-acyl-sn-glycerol-3-phosphate acyltransferase